MDDGEREMDRERRKGRDGEEARKREKETNRERARETVQLLPSVGQLGSVQLLGVLEKRSHHLQAIIPCPHLDRLLAPVTRPVRVTSSNKRPKINHTITTEPNRHLPLAFPLKAVLKKEPKKLNRTQ